jgi:UDP-GlcNAc:undecaprenyl-phosphate GlcNAc-1-phosphate transferase
LENFVEIVFQKLPYWGIAFSTALIFASLTPLIHNMLKRNNDTAAVQAAHSNPTLRFGGVACFLAILFGSFTADAGSSIALMLVVAGAPLFIVGLLEDFGIHMSPKKRLVAIAISVLCAIYIFQISINHVGVPGLDLLLSFSAFAVLFTVFAVSGVVNAFNLIDGINGLASYTAATVAISLSVIAFGMGHQDLQDVSILIMLSALGFFAVNYPLGRIFLGDAGAYFLGFILVCVALILCHRQPEISPFAILLVFFWPVADTCLAIWRRLRLSTPHDRPDRLHFHQLVMRFLEIRILGRNSRTRSNPIATLVLMPLIAAPQIVGVIFITDHLYAVFAVLIFSALFFGSYVFGMELAKRGHRRMSDSNQETPNDSVAAE